MYVVLRLVSHSQITTFLLFGDGKVFFPPLHQRKVAVWLCETTFLNDNDMPVGNFIGPCCLVHTTYKIHFV